MSGWVPPLPARWADPARPTFVGRRAELATLEEIWAAVDAGLRQVVFLGGEPGGGKSRLLAEVSTALHRSGATVLLGTCAAEFGAPYQPFVEPIEALLARSLPERDADRLRTLAGQPAAADHEHRRELFDSVVDAVRTAAGEAPLVLALEDLHWAGPAALQLLTYLVERTAECRLLVLGTHRTTAPDRSGALVGTIAQLYRLDGVRRLDLAGLDTEDIAEFLLAEGQLSLKRARSSAALLRDQTGGNPFFLRELWQDLSARGAQPDDLRAPISVRDTVASRLERLPEVERRTLELAAVIGEDVDVAALLAAADTERAVTLTALDGAVASGLLEAPVGGGIRFVHALARQAVLELMPASRRALRHAHVAGVLETTMPPSEARSQRLAFHYAQAAALGFTEQAVRYLTEAAQAADRSLAHEDAGAAYEQAAALAAVPAERDRLLHSAAASHLMGGDFGRARLLAERVAGTAGPRERLEAAILYEDAAWRPGLHGARAVELLTDGLHAVTGDPADPLRVRGMASLGRALAFTGATEVAATVGDHAIVLARSADDDHLLAHALQASLWNGMRPADMPTKLERAAELTTLARRTEEPRYLAQSAYFRGAIGYMRGDPDGLAQAQEDLLRAGRFSGEDFYAYVAGCMRYALQFVEGDLTGAQRTCDELLEFGEAFGSDDTEGVSAVQSFMVRRESGALERIRPLITGEERPQDHWAPGLLALYTELGLDRPAARVLHWLLDGRLDRFQESAQWPAVLVFAVEAALRLGDQPAARTLRPMLDEYAGLNLVAGQFVAVFGAADRYRGALESLLGTGGAEELFAAALDLDERMEAPLHRAYTLVALARHLRRSGVRGARLDAVVAEARALAEPLGLRRVLDLLQAEPEPRPAGPAGLTARETEVLRLLADGMLNREIAERLFISENTAANHVRSILAKTGSGNRTQAARFAVLHRLLD
ncbi:helix-turn-helix transcriptional regulator [Geodermatophilus sp. URMC 64]